jgi:hypothetical protein
MIIYKCDKCGKTAETKRGVRSPMRPDGWFTLTHGQYSNGREYHICPECRKSLDIPDDYGKATGYIGDQLIEIIGEIVSEHMQA